MLVLTRKHGDKIFIQQDGKIIATLFIIKSLGDVKIGIEAEQSIRIERAELVKK